MQAERIGGLGAVCLAGISPSQCRRIRRDADRDMPATRREAAVALLVRRQARPGARRSFGSAIDVPAGPAPGVGSRRHPEGRLAITSRPRWCAGADAAGGAHRGVALAVRRLVAVVRAAGAAEQAQDPPSAARRSRIRSSSSATATYRSRCRRIEPSARPRSSARRRRCPPTSALAAVAPVNENDDMRSDGTTHAPRNPRRHRRSRLTASTLASASR